MPYTRSTIRTMLFAGVSSLALTVGAAEVRAADLAPVPKAVLKAPMPVDYGQLTMWFEGGAFYTGGKDVSVSPPPFPAGDFNGMETDGLSPFGVTGMRPRVGWEGAVGLDYRLPNSPWHLSFDVRYGQAKAKNKNFFATQSGSEDTADITVGATVKHRESHWVADFMVGRDVGLGFGLNQVKVGLRVAELRASTNASGVYFCNSEGGGYCDQEFTGNTFLSATTVEQRSRFLGIGPRVAVEGALPLSARWVVDYGAGMAVLFGERRLEYIQSGVNSASGINENVFRFNSYSTGGVFNLDANAALGYWLTPRFKISAGYRFDGYWSALRTFQGAGAIANVQEGIQPTASNVDRFYHGPFVRVTGKF